MNSSNVGYINICTLIQLMEQICFFMLAHKLSYSYWCLFLFPGLFNPRRRWSSATSIPCLFHGLRGDFLSCLSHDILRIGNGRLPCLPCHSLGLSHESGDGLLRRLYCDLLRLFHGSGYGLLSRLSRNLLYLSHESGDGLLRRLYRDLLWLFSGSAYGLLSRLSRILLYLSHESGDGLLRRLYRDLLRLFSGSAYGLLSRLSRILFNSVGCCLRLCLGGHLKSIDTGQWSLRRSPDHCGTCTFCSRAISRITLPAAISLYMCASIGYIIDEYTPLIIL